MKRHHVYFTSNEINTFIADSIDLCEIRKTLLNLIYEGKILIKHKVFDSI